MKLAFQVDLRGMAAARCGHYHYVIHRIEDRDGRTIGHRASVSRGHRREAVGDVATFGTRRDAVAYLERQAAALTTRGRP